MGVVGLGKDWYFYIFTGELGEVSACSYTTDQNGFF